MASWMIIRILSHVHTYSQNTQKHMLITILICIGYCVSYEQWCYVFTKPLCTCTSFTLITTSHMVILFYVFFAQFSLDLKCNCTHLFELYTQFDDWTLMKNINAGVNIPIFIRNGILCAENGSSKANADVEITVWYISRSWSQPRALRRWRAANIRSLLCRCRSPFMQIRESPIEVNGVMWDFTKWFIAYFFSVEWLGVFWSH